MGHTTIELLQTAVRAAESRKATDAVILDLRGISSVTDFFIVCSGTSDINVKAIAEAVEEEDHGILFRGARVVIRWGVDIVNLHRAV